MGQILESPMFPADLLSGHEPGRARLLPSRLADDRDQARRQPRPTTNGRFMEKWSGARLACAENAAKVRLNRSKT